MKKNKIIHGIFIIVGILGFLEYTFLKGLFLIFKLPSKKFRTLYIYFAIYCCGYHMSLAMSILFRIQYPLALRVFPCSVRGFKIFVFVSKEVKTILIRETKILNVMNIINSFLSSLWSIDTILNKTIITIN